MTLEKTYYRFTPGSMESLITKAKSALEDTKFFYFGNLATNLSICVESGIAFRGDQILLFWQDFNLPEIEVKRVLVEFEGAGLIEFVHLAERREIP